MKNAVTDLDRMIDELRMYKSLMASAVDKLQNIRQAIANGKALSGHDEIRKRVAADLAFYSVKIDRLSEELGLFAFDFSEEGA